MLDCRRAVAPQQVLQATGRGVAADLGQLAAILALGPTEQTL